MKKVKLIDSSISKLMNHITCEIYTKQTLVSLFRCLVETILESGNNSVILIKMKDTKDFQGLLNRLKYSESNVYSYSEIGESDNFTRIEVNDSYLLNDEFLVIIADRFSSCLFWEETKTGIYQGFCSLNPDDTNKIFEHLQLISNNKNLEKDLSELKQDRRSNEKFTTILRKFTESFENQQMDLICADTELKELQKKVNQSEKFTSIGQLCSTIAHEIRNPLGMINLYAKIISKNADEVKSTAISKSLKGAASTITSAITNLEDLLTQLSNFSKPLTITKTFDDLNVAVNDVVNLVKPAFDEKLVNLSIVNKFNNKIKIDFDRPKISQALLNIIKNALEISKQGDMVELFITLKDEKTVSILVKDQGTGIALKDRAKLFTPFFTTKKEGTGLGLARSKKIIEAHGGNLNLISTDESGTTFELTLQI
ncbi:MAG: ATP-binding protein [Candidatus Gastranaerophilales bacterium]|nr:ATP-binding protein [Candidatus Gastranaerophilales bacterium]